MVETLPDIPTSPAPAPVRRLLALSLVALALLAIPAWAGYDEGQRIELTGLVTDPAGHPMANIHVVLEASRSGFSITRLGATKKDPTRLIGLTNERGEYSLEWPWNRYYNSFELLVGVPIRRPDGERLKVLERIDISQKIKRGSPVVSAVVVQNYDYVAKLRAFLATIGSEDERSVHQQMGEPDKVERVEYPDRVEVAWWFFEAGKVYRFKNGRLEKIDPFDPVKGF
jgi:hypothetical protein